MESAHRTLVILLLFALLPGCSDDTTKTKHDGSTSDGPQAGDGGPPAKQLKWTLTTLDTERAGKHAAIGSAGAVIGVAYYRDLANTVEKICPTSGSGTPGGPKQRPAQDLYFVKHDGSSWGTPLKLEQTVGPPYGLSLTYDRGSGKAFLGYLGGALSQNECASSDAVIASSADGQSWNHATLAAAGPIGDTVGYWMSVAVDSTGKEHAAYHDPRFGYYEQDGRMKASARYDSGEAIAENNGAGVFNSLVFDSQDRPVVAFFNPTLKDKNGGVQLAVKKSAAWELQQVITGATAERLSLGTNGQGLFGIAYYEPGDKLLRYKWSEKDLTGWKDEVVDPDLTHNGEFGSLAYDSQGNPGISYYKCGSYTGSTCDPIKDGVKFAYRLNGRWKTYDVDAGGANRCGTYTSLTFAPGDVPVIAYQCVVLHNQTNEFLDSLKVARGVYQ